MRFISLDAAAEREETPDDTRERLARFLDHGPIEQPPRNRFGRIAAIVVLLALLGLVGGWLWVGPRAGGMQPGIRGNAEIIDPRSTEPVAAPAGVGDWAARGDATENMGGPEMAPHTPQRSSRPGGPGGLLDSLTASDAGRSDVTDVRRLGRIYERGADGITVTPPVARAPAGSPARESAPARRLASTRDPAAERRGGSVETMAGYLVTTYGIEGAEAQALGTAEWYVAASADFAYWQRVAAAVRRTRAPRR